MSPLGQATKLQMDVILLVNTQPKQGRLQLSDMPPKLSCVTDVAVFYISLYSLLTYPANRIELNTARL